MSGYSPEPDDLSAFEFVEGDDEHLLLLETGDLVSRFTLWVEGVLDYNDLSDRQKESADRLLDDSKQHRKKAQD